MYLTKKAGDKVILYHGSKSGIKGDIKPQSRHACDFGCGFYMGDRPEQPKSLVVAYPSNMFYEIDYNMDGLSKKEFENDTESQLDWALYIAYNRGVTDFSKHENLRIRYESYNTTSDIIIGLIADDKMTQVMNLFFNGRLCDKAFIEALQYVKLGKQYVLKTDKACDKDRIKIINSYSISEKEKSMILAQNINRRNQLSGFINQIERKYRRAQNVKFFDEIMEEWNQ